MLALQPLDRRGMRLLAAGCVQPASASSPAAAAAAARAERHRSSALGRRWRPARRRPASLSAMLSRRLRPPAELLDAGQRLADRASRATASA